MTVTIGSTAFPRLTAQPFVYEESDTRNGRTARSWEIEGLLTPTEWLDILSEYDTWRDLRILDEDTVSSGVVGTTILFSGSGPGGQSWTNVACWFSAAPKASAAGSYLSVSLALVDADEALEIILSDQEQQSGEGEIDLGTITIGTTQLTLLKVPDGYANSPEMDLTPGGIHFITGSTVPYRIKDVEGRTDLTGWNNIRSWYENTITQTPTAGDYFPISAPSASAESYVNNGVKTTAYIVSIQLGEVI